MEGEFFKCIRGWLEGFEVSVKELRRCKRDSVGGWGFWGFWDVGDEGFWDLITDTRVNHLF